MGFCNGIVLNIQTPCYHVFERILPEWFTEDKKILRKCMAIASILVLLTKDMCLLCAWCVQTKSFGL